MKLITYFLNPFQKCNSNSVNVHSCWFGLCSSYVQNVIILICLFVLKDGDPGKSINYHQYYPTYCLIFPAQHLHSTMQANQHVPSSANVGHFQPHNNNPIYYKDERTQRQYIKLEKKLHDKQMLRNENTSLIREEVSNNLRQTEAKVVDDMNSLGTSEDGEESSIADDENIQIITEILSAVHPPKVRTCTNNIKIKNKTKMVTLLCKFHALITTFMLINSFLNMKIC